MKKNVILLIPLMLFGALLAACTTASAAGSALPATQNDAQPTQRTISVSGTGQVYLTPDMATVSIGVQTEGKKAARALEENSQRTAEVINTIRKFGIAASDIRTTNFSISPSYDYGPNGERLGIYYVVNNTVVVTVRDLEVIGDLLDAVVQAGSNQIYGIQFDVSDRTSALADARRAAVADARAQAEQLAQAAGVQLGDVISITASVSGGGPVYRMAAMAEAASVPIESGQIALSVSVQMVYAIQP